MLVVTRRAWKSAKKPFSATEARQTSKDTGLPLSPTHIPQVHRDHTAGVARAETKMQKLRPECSSLLID